MSLLARVLVVLVLVCLPSFGLCGSEPLEVKPPRLGQADRSGELGREMRYLCLRQLGADCRERLVFGGESYLKELFTRAEAGKRMSEHQIRPLAGLVFAAGVAFEFNDYDESAAGISRVEMARIAVSLTRELASHHVANTDRSSWWWGNEWQSAYWTASAATGAWLIWDRLPADTRLMAAKMVEFEANRFLGKPAPFNEFSDTKCEENAWNSEVMVLAYCMLPDHPNRAAWYDKALEYMITAYAAPQDLGSSRVVDGKPLSQWLVGANIHRDYTVENHGFFHPDYLISYYMSVINMIPLTLAGEPLPEAPLFNARQARDIYQFMALPSGWTFYPQSTDWNNYRTDVEIMAQMPDPVSPDPIGARALRWGLECLRYTDAPNSGKQPRNLFLGMNFNCCPLQTITSVYLMHYLLGPGAPPLTTEQALAKLAGTRIFEQGKCAVTRSRTGIASFSWFDSGRRLMAAVSPLAIDAFALPKFRSLIGHFGKDYDPAKILEQRISALPGGGFVAGVSMERGPEMRIRERVMMVALPDGRVIWAEFFDPSEVDPGEVRAGLVFYETNPVWTRGTKARVVCSPQLRQQAAEGGGRWVNLGDRMGIVVRGSDDVKLGDGWVSLNYRPADGKPMPKRVVAVFYPGADSRNTAQLDRSLRVEDLPGGAVRIALGDRDIVLEPGELAVR